MRPKPKAHECPGGKGIPDEEWTPKSKVCCNCNNCKHKNCPDIMKRIGLSISTSGTNARGCKRVRRKTASEDIELAPEKDPSILALLNQNRDCNCEIMARALRSPVPRNKSEDVPENPEELASNSKKH